MGGANGRAVFCYDTDNINYICAANTMYEHARRRAPDIPDQPNNTALMHFDLHKIIVLRLTWMFFRLSQRAPFDAGGF